MRRNAKRSFFVLFSGPLSLLFEQDFSPSGLTSHRRPGITHYGVGSLVFVVVFFCFWKMRVGSTTSPSANCSTYMSLILNVRVISFSAFDLELFHKNGTDFFLIFSFFFWEVLVIARRQAYLYPSTHFPSMESVAIASSSPPFLLITIIVDICSSLHMLH